MPRRADLPALDRRILAAFGELTEARARFLLDPCGEVVTACESAEETLNELLEQRFALTRPAAATSRSVVAA